MGTYAGVENDPDINKFEQADIQDLAESGVGEGLRGFIIWIPLIVLVVVLIWLKVRAVRGAKKN